MALPMGTLGAGVASTSRRVSLDFPPPPTYPPPFSEAARSMVYADVSGNAMMMAAGPSMMMPPGVVGHRVQRAPQDYSYAYYGPGPSHHVHREVPYYHQQRGNIADTCFNDSHKRHTYLTHYGTEENIYEEISDIRYIIRIYGFFFFLIEKKKI